MSVDISRTLRISVAIGRTIRIWVDIDTSLSIRRALRILVETSPLLILGVVRIPGFPIGNENKGKTQWQIEETTSENTTTT